MDCGSVFGSLVQAPEDPILGVCFPLALRHCFCDHFIYWLFFSFMSSWSERVYKFEYDPSYTTTILIKFNMFGLRSIDDFIGYINFCTCGLISGFDGLIVLFWWFKYIKWVFIFIAVIYLACRRQEGHDQTYFFVEISSCWAFCLLIFVVYVWINRLLLPITRIPAQINWI